MRMRPKLKAGAAARPLLLPVGSFGAAPRRHVSLPAACVRYALRLSSPFGLVGIEVRFCLGGTLPAREQERVRLLYVLSNSLRLRDESFLYGTVLFSLRLSLFCCMGFLSDFAL